MVDNIHVRTDPAGNIKPNKQKSTEKIDGVVATIMALDRASPARQQADRLGLRHQRFTGAIRGSEERSCCLYGFYLNLTVGEPA
nr:phage terminase family protein [Brevibacterium sp. Marseille-P9724]